MLSFDPMPPLFIELPVLAREKIEQQAIVHPAVYAMALPLPADETKTEALYGPERRVMLHQPGIDRM